MGPFDFLQKKGSKALKPQPAQIRKEIVSIIPNPRKVVNPTPQRSNAPVRPIKRTKPSDPHTALHPSKSRRQDSKKRQLSEQPRLDSDSEDGFFDGVSEASNKRLRISPSVEPDRNRLLRCKKPLLEDEEILRNMVHAAEIASLKMPVKYKPAFPNDPEATHILLQYPSESAKERYNYLSLLALFQLTILGMN